MSECIHGIRRGVMSCDACECDEAEAERDEAVALLRAIWHGEGADKWPDPTEFRRRVEALVGPSPTGQELAVTYYERIVPRIEDLTFVRQEYEPIEEEQS
jgi:hypothetical protein